MKCPTCGGTLKHKSRFSTDKRLKKPKIIRRLECRCKYEVPADMFRIRRQGRIAMNEERPSEENYCNG